MDFFFTTMYYIDAHIYMCTGRKEALARCKFLRKSSRPSSPENWSRRENDCDNYVQLRTILGSIGAFALFPSWKTKPKRCVLLLQSCIKVYIQMNGSDCLEQMIIQFAIRWIELHEPDPLFHRMSSSLFYNSAELFLVFHICCPLLNYCTH